MEIQRDGKHLGEGRVAEVGHWAWRMSKRDTKEKDSSRREPILETQLKLDHRSNFR